MFSPIYLSLAIVTAIVRVVYIGIAIGNNAILAPEAVALMSPVMYLARMFYLMIWAVDTSSPANTIAIVVFAIITCIADVIACVYDHLSVTTIAMNFIYIIIISAKLFTGKQSRFVHEAAMVKISVVYILYAFLILARILRLDIDVDYITDVYVLTAWAYIFMAARIDSPKFDNELIPVFVMATFAALGIYSYAYMVDCDVNGITGPIVNIMRAADIIIGYIATGMYYVCIAVHHYYTMRYL